MAWRFHAINAPLSPSLRQLDAIFSLVDFHTGRRWRKIRRDKERSLERKEAKRLRREARWKQALEEQVKPEYRFGLDPCPTPSTRRLTG